MVEVSQDHYFETCDKNLNLCSWMLEIHIQRTVVETRRNSRAPDQTSLTTRLQWQNCQRRVFYLIDCPAQAPRLRQPASNALFEQQVLKMKWSVVVLDGTHGNNSPSISIAKLIDTSSNCEKSLP